MQAPGFLPLVVALAPLAALPQSSPPDTAAPIATTGQGVVRGHVVDPDGRPVAGARIEVTTHVNPAAGLAVEATATSDRTGAFEVTGRPSGPTWVAAEHPGFAPGSGAETAIDPARGPTDVRIVLRRGGRILGSVRRRDGSPIPEAALVFFSHQENQRTGQRRPPTRVRDDGAFEMVHLVPGRGVLIATIGPPGLDQRAIGRKIEIQDEAIATADLVLEEVVVSGRVTRSGAPGAGLRVSVVNRYTYEMRTLVSRLLYGTETGSERNTTLADEDGAYSLVADAPGPAFVQVGTADHRTRFPSQDVEIPDSDTHVIDLAVGGAWIAGIVTDQATGEPLPSVSVSARAPGPGSDPGGGSTRTDSEGRFQLEAAPGEYRLDVRQPEKGYETRTVPISVPESGLTDLRVAIARAPAITVRVADADRRPVAGAFIWICDTDGRWVHHGEERTDANGRLLLKNLQQRPYNLLARSMLDGTLGFRPGVQPGPNDAVITLQHGSKLTVRPIEPPGRPVTQAQVEIETIDGHAVVGAQRGWADLQGIAELPAPPGLIGLLVRAGPLQGRTVVSVAAGGDADVVVTMEKAPTNPRPPRR